MASERNTLPGSPSNTLIREVRSVLYRRLRSKPQREDQTWKMAWQWAAECCNRRELWRFGKRPRRRPWPSACEIASQYVLLALLDMREYRDLRLPYNAAECVPPAITARFGAVGAFPRLEVTPSVTRTEVGAESEGAK